jgi:hypothetical protein
MDPTKEKNKNNNNIKTTQKDDTVGTVQKYTVGRGNIDTLKHKYMTDY